MCCSRRRTPSAARRRPMTRRTRTRTRTKTRRPKFLSLRRQLAPPEPPNMPAPSAAPHTADHLHDRDPNVACLLEPDDAGSATLNALLGAADGAAAPQSSPSPASSSMNWDADEDGLARRALRGRERWVFCCSSASPSSSSEEVASSAGGFDLLRGAPPQALSLKLDYEEILTAWSDRGPLYIDGDGPQVVPELHDTTMFVEVGSAGNACSVPTMTAEGKEAVGSREARVMRYKEKRRSRLFTKRIRYEVRKLNAEKRPRMKGRFVKRKDDE